MKKPKILIFGNGQIGNFYQDYFTDQKLAESIITSTDITNLEEIEHIINQNKPNIVINTAAKTNLEWCANNKLQAFNVNTLGPDNLAKICDQQNIYFVHISSGCILASLNETDLKNEEDIPHPISYYSWTKVWAENMITFKRSTDFKYLILRPRQPISAKVSYKNMLVKMLTFTKFIDTPNSGTSIEDLMDWTWQLISQNATGVFHVGNEGWTTPYQIGLLLKKYVLPELPIEKISKEELNKLTPEARVDTILDVSKLKKHVRNVRPYTDALEDTIKKLAINFKTEKAEVIKEQLEKTLAQTKSRTIPNTVWTQLLK